MTGALLDDDLELLLDTRVRDKNLERKTIDAKTVQKYLDSLPDCAELAEYIDLPTIEASDQPAVTRPARDDVEDAQDELLSDKL